MTFLWPLLLARVVARAAGLLVARRDRRAGGGGRLAALLGGAGTGGAPARRPAAAAGATACPAVARRRRVRRARDRAGPAAGDGRRCRGSRARSCSRSTSRRAWPRTTSRRRGWRRPRRRRRRSSSASRRASSIGVVAFSDAGLSVQAPTSDQAAVLAAIDRLGAGPRARRSGRGSSPSLGAIEQAESRHPGRLLQQPLARRRPRRPAPVAPGSHDAAAIVLFSDGENNERPGSDRRRPGRRRPRDPDPDGRRRDAAGTTLDLDGFRVQTALDEALLQQIADLTGGHVPAGRRRVDPARVYPSSPSASSPATRRSRSRRSSRRRARPAGRGRRSLSLARSGRLP